MLTAHPYHMRNRVTMELHATHTASGKLEIRARKHFIILVGQPN